MIRFVYLAEAEPKLHTRLMLVPVFVCSFVRQELWLSSRWKVQWCVILRFDLIRLNNYCTTYAFDHLFGVVVLKFNCWGDERISTCKGACCGVEEFFADYKLQ